MPSRLHLTPTRLPCAVGCRARSVTEMSGGDLHRKQRAQERARHGASESFTFKPAINAARAVVRTGSVAKA